MELTFITTALGVVLWLHGYTTTWCLHSVKATFGGGTHYFCVAFLYYTQYIPVKHWQLQRGTANTSQGITTWSLRSDHKNTKEDTGLHLFEAKKRRSASWAAISLLNLPRMEVDHKNFSPVMNMVQRNLSYLHLQPEPKYYQRARKHVLILRMLRKRFFITCTQWGVWMSNYWLFNQI